MTALACKFVLSLAAPDHETLLRLAQDPRLDWEAARRLADQHGMVGIAAPALQRLPDGRMPDQARARWTGRWMELQARDLAQRAQLERILKAASGAGLQPLLLKGFSLHLQAYDPETARGASDLDLMVRPGEVLAMRGCLGRLGFRFRGTDSWSRPVSDWRRFVERDSEAQFESSPSGVWVDLHWRLCAPELERACGLSLSERLWDSPRLLQIGRVKALIPGREEELLMLALHLVKMGRFSLRHLCDFSRMLRSDPPADWDRLVKVAEETGGTGCLFWALHLAGQLAPVPIPKAIRSELSRAAGPRRLLGPSLQINHLMRTRGESLLDFSHFWHGIFFVRRPARWLPYQARRISGWVVRRLSCMLR